MFEYSYFIYSLAFLFLWFLVFFGGDKKIRKEMLFVSIVLSPIGSISEVWYFSDYWLPETLFNSFLNIEDFIFSFSLGGISFGLYKVAFNLVTTEWQPYKKRMWLPVLCLFVLVIGLAILSGYLGHNSVVVSAVLFFILSVMIWVMRDDLIFPSLLSGLFVVAAFFLIYQFFLFIHPRLIDEWCLKCNPSGIKFHGVNIEELLWDFSWGMMCGVLYEATTGKAFYREKVCVDENLVLSEYGRYDDFLNGFSNENNAINNVFYNSTKSIVIHRAIRKISFFFSRKVNGVLSDYYGMLTIILIPFLIDIPSYFFDFNVGSVALCWLCYYSILSWLLFILPKIAWDGLVSTSTHLDEIIINQSDKDKIVNWMNHRLSMKRQYLLAILAGFITVFSLLLLAPAFNGYVKFGISSYIQVFLNAFFGMVAVYWLWHIPLFINELRTIDGLNLLWYSPVDSPFIKNLTLLLSKSALLALVGMVVTVLPLFYYINKLASSEIILVSGMIFILSSVTVIFISVFPQYWIVEMVTRSKDKVLQKILADIPSISVSDSMGDLLTIQKVLIYNSISSSKTSVLDHKNILNYAVSILLTFFPYLLSLFDELAKYF